MHENSDHSDIVKELSDYIAKNPCVCSEYIHDPSTLVGRPIRHRFETDDAQMKWYNGNVVGHDAVTKTHEINYEGEEEYCNSEWRLGNY